MNCTVCGKDFGKNQTNYDRHMGSKEHLGRLLDSQSNLAIAEREKVVVGAPPTPPHTAVVSMVPPPSFAVAPTPRKDSVTPVLIAAPTLTFNWKKWVAIAAGVLLVLYILDTMEKRNRTPQLAAGTASAPARSLPGNLTNTIPPALIGIVGLLMLSKLLRVELSGWNKIFKDWAK